MPFTVYDAMRQLGECPSVLATTFFGQSNQATLQKALADRVADAMNVRIGEQDLLACMVRAYRAAPHTSIDTDADVDAMNRLLLGAVAPYVIRSMRMHGWRAARYDAGVPASTAPPVISPVAMSSTYDSSVPDAPVGLQGSTLSLAPV